MTRSAHTLHPSTYPQNPMHTLLTQCLQQTAKDKRTRLYRKRCKWLEKPLPTDLLRASRRKQLAIVASLF